MRAANSGTFTVVVGDGNNDLGGTGDYRLTLAKTGSPIVITPGEQGGPMTNGWTHTGTINTGTLDAWSFTAQAGQSLVVRVGDFTGTANLIPWVRLYGPDGAELGGGGFSQYAGEVAVRATSSGTFTVLVADGNNGYGGTGDYRLTLAETGDPIVISPGEQGGPMTNGWTHTGTINTGTLDEWSFTAQRRPTRGRARRRLHGNGQSDSLGSALWPGRSGVGRRWFQCSMPARSAWRRPTAAPLPCWWPMETTAMAAPAITV